MVIRSAAGIFYGRDENVPVARRPTNNPPYFILSTYTSDQIDPSIVLSQGFPANALDPANVKNPAVNSHLRHSPTPYVQQWNFNVQRELRLDWWRRSRMSAPVRTTFTIRITSICRRRARAKSSRGVPYRELRPSMSTLHL